MFSTHAVGLGVLGTRDSFGDDIYALFESECERHDVRIEDFLLADLSKACRAGPKPSCWKIWSWHSSFII